MKGFTLVELLAVLVILGIVSIVVVSNVTGVIGNSKSSLSETQKSSIIEATKKYVIYNQSGLPLDSNASPKIITLSELSSAGYIDTDDVVDPKTNEVMTGCVEVSYNDGTEQYNYKFKTSGC